MNDQEFQALVGESQQCQTDLRRINEFNTLENSHFTKVICKKIVTTNTIDMDSLKGDFIYLLLANFAFLKR